MTPAAAWPRLGRGLVAILRGIRPEETADHVRALLDAGFEAIEVPLNSPEPLRSIAIAAEVASGRALVGAGTVLAPAEVAAVASAGGRLIVSPNTDPAVIGAAAALGLVALPGIFTATEAFAALAAGASALKIFPASALGPAGVAALRAVLPPGTRLAAVGGVAEDAFAAWGRAGIRCFGLGSSLYRPGASPGETAARAGAAIAAWDAAFGP
jgi:2-dehydro-3-deoxyphosphogalactonate aldolase